jgi:hypothetical protein
LTFRRRRRLRSLMKRSSGGAMFDVSVHSLAFGWPGSFRAGSSFGRRSYAHSLALSSKCKHGISRAHLRLFGYKVFSWLSLSFFPSSNVLCFLVPKGRERPPMSVPSCPFSQNHYGWLHDLRVLLLCRVLQNLRNLLMRKNRTVYYAMFAAHVLFSKSCTGST